MITKWYGELLIFTFMLRGFVGACKFFRRCSQIRTSEWPICWRWSPLQWRAAGGQSRVVAWTVLLVRPEILADEKASNFVWKPHLPGIKKPWEPFKAKKNLEKNSRIGNGGARVVFRVSTHAVQNLRQPSTLYTNSLRNCRCPKKVSRATLERNWKPRLWSDVSKPMGINVWLL